MENTKVYMALNCCLKITMPNLHKIGLKMRELCFKNLAPLRVGPRASLHYTPPPQENVPLGHIFSLLAMNGPLPCLLYTSPSPRDGLLSRMPSSA